MIPGIPMVCMRAKQGTTAAASTVLTKPEANVRLMKSRSAVSMVCSKWLTIRGSSSAKNICGSSPGPLRPRPLSPGRKTRAAESEESMLAVWQ